MGSPVEAGRHPWQGLKPRTNSTLRFCLETFPSYKTALATSIFCETSLSHTFPAKRGGETLEIGWFIFVERVERAQCRQPPQRASGLDPFP